MASSEEDDFTKCPVCLDFFTKDKKPKFLSCHHTVCERCIDQIAVVRMGISDLPCPECRQTTTIPEAGAGKLQVNYYIKTVDTAAKVQELCRSHPEKELESFCADCDAPICIDCKLTLHEPHKTEDLCFAVKRRKLDLQPDKERLQKALEDIRANVESLQNQRETLRKQRETAEQNIQERHDQVVQASAKHKEQQQAYLRSSCSDLDKKLLVKMNKLAVKSDPLSTLLCKMDSALDSKATKVFSVIDEVRTLGSQESVEALMVEEEISVGVPDIRPAINFSAMAETNCDFLGHFSMIESHCLEMEMEMKVMKRFQCSQDPDTEVFSLCHEDGDPPRLIVSYDRLGGKENAPVQEFTESGQCVRTCDGDEVGRVCYKRFAEGRCMFASQETERIYAYRKSPASPHFNLENDLKGEAKIKIVSVTSSEPFRCEHKTKFTIQVGRHRSFDVDCSKKYFAVVEEAKRHCSSRQVRLYKRSRKRAIHTYQPHLENFQPVDVLFHTLGGQPVLLVADQLNSTLHVVSYQGGLLRFERYLCQGCPFLDQPTALTVDVRNRVWVACKGGDILTIEHLQ